MGTVQKKVTRSKIGKFKAYSVNDSSYEIQVDESTLNVLLSKISDWIGEADSLIVTTPSVDKYFGSLIKQALNECSSYHILQCRELNKDLEQVRRFCNYALEININRIGVSFGAGGGVCKVIPPVDAQTKTGLKRNFSCDAKELKKFLNRNAGLLEISLYAHAD